MARSTDVSMPAERARAWAASSKAPAVDAEPASPPALPRLGGALDLVEKVSHAASCVDAEQPTEVDRLARDKHLQPAAASAFEREREPGVGAGTAAVIEHGDGKADRRASAISRRQPTPTTPPWVPNTTKPESVGRHPRPGTEPSCVGPVAPPAGSYSSASGRTARKAARQSRSRVMP